jgi:spoIIIJ-associated protein
MTGFLSKIFGGKKKADVSNAQAIIEETLQGLVERGQFQIDFDIREVPADGQEGREFVVELHGEDEELLTEKEGQLLDSIQLFLKRVLQHRADDERVNVTFDCNGFREEANRSLVELAEKLKGIALEKGKSVYFRALPPKDRKVIHQHLANDSRVKSRSIGDGLYKKIKIYPVKSSERDQQAEHESAKV